MEGRVVALVVVVSVVLASSGCEKAQCDELHDPSCWIPPVTDAASDADDGDEDGQAERDVVTNDATALPAAGDATALSAASDASTSPPGDGPTNGD